MSNERKYRIVPASPETKEHVKNIAEEMARFSEPLGKALRELEGTEEEKAAYNTLADGPFNWYKIIQNSQLFDKVFHALEGADKGDLANQLALFKQEEMRSDENN